MQQEIQVHKGRAVQLAQQGLKVLQVIQDHKEDQEELVLQDHKVLQVIQDHKEVQEHKELQGQMVLQDLPEMQLYLIQIVQSILIADQAPKQI